MSSLSNQQFNTKTMTGISDSYSNNIICDSLEITQNLTVDVGAIISFPPSSISDISLSSNVTLKNGSNIFVNTNKFTGPSTFENAVIIKNSSILTIQGTTENGVIKYLDSGSNLVIQNNTPGTGFIYLRCVNTTGVLVSIMSLTYNAISIYKPMFLGGVSINSVGYITYSDTTTQSTAYPGSSNFALLNANNIFTGTTNTVPTPVTSDNSQTICNTAFVKSQSYITASSLTPYALIAGNNIFTGTTNTVPTPVTSDNSQTICNTAFVKSQSYITASSLTPYALIAGNNIFTGTTNTVPTPVTSDNSQTICNTAYVKNQSYITASSLTPYALIAGNNIFTGTNTVPTPVSSDNSQTICNTAYVKNQSYITASSLPSLSNYAVLNNGTLTQNYLGNNTFSNTAGTPPIVIRNTSNANVSGSLVICNVSSQYSPCNVYGDLILGSIDTSTSTGGISICPLSTSTCGIHVENTSLDLYGGVAGVKFHNKISTTYNTSTYIARTALQLGFEWFGAPFVTWLTSSITNIWSVVWDGTGDKQWGVFLVEIFIITTGSGTGTFSASLNNSSATAFFPSSRFCQAGSSNLPSPYLGLKVMSMSFVENIFSSTNYFLNTYVVSAGSNIAQLGSSYIKFTRIG